jgi:hypothetical protein
VEWSVTETLQWLWRWPCCVGSRHQVVRWSTQFTIKSDGAWRARPGQGLPHRRPATAKEQRGAPVLVVNRRLLRRRRTGGRQKSDDDSSAADDERTCETHLAARPTTVAGAAGAGAGAAGAAGAGAGDAGAGAGAGDPPTPPTDPRHPPSHPRVPPNATTTKSHHHPATILTHWDWYAGSCVAPSLRKSGQSVASPNRRCSKCRSSSGMSCTGLAGGDSSRCSSCGDDNDDEDDEDDCDDDDDNRRHGCTTKNGSGCAVRLLAPRTW